MHPASLRSAGRTFLLCHAKPRFAQRHAAISLKRKGLAAAHASQQRSPSPQSSSA
jgi:hypothetical protein